MTAQRGTNTRAVHSSAAPASASRPLSPAVVRSTTFAAESADVHRSLFQEAGPGFYLRFGDHNSTEAAAAVAALEGAEAALMFSSGMGAVATSLLTILRSGDHVVAQREIFDQTGGFLNHLAGTLGVDVTFVDTRNLAEVSAAMMPRTRIVYAESPSNPMLRIAPLAELAKIAESAGALCIVDSTFASPVLQQPLTLGVHLVIHSGTKFLGGHSDVMCGVVAGNREMIARIRQMQILLGTVLAPDASWLMLRGLRTIGLRVPQQAATALRVATFLQSHPAVREVRYPFLPGFESYRTATSQMTGGGGVITFSLRGDRATASDFLGRLKLIAIATSLGGIESVIELPFDLDFAEHTESAEPWMRLSIGIEDADDLMADIAKALGE